MGAECSCLQHPAHTMEERLKAQMATNACEFSQEQRDVAYKMADPEWRGSITALCEECGVSRSAFYDWMGKPEFREYVDSLIERYTDSELSTVWKALIDACAKGNVMAIRLYFEMKNKYKTAYSVTIEDDPLTRSLKEEAEKLNAIL